MVTEGSHHVLLHPGSGHRAYSLKAGAPASAAGERKQPLVHSMGLIRLIETFCLRLRGLHRAIILEGSQGPFRAEGEEHGQVAQCRPRVAR